MKKFQRSLSDKRVAGVFGGLGDALGIDSAYLRLAFILVTLFTGVLPALIGYAIGWAITPEAPADGGSRE